MFLMIDEIIAELASADYICRREEENKNKRVLILDRLSNSKSELNRQKEFKTQIKTLTDIVKKYLSDKQTKVLSDIALILQKCKDLVQSEENYTLVSTPNTILIQTDDGNSLTDTQGTGMASVLSLLLRIYLIKENPDTNAKKFLIADEAVSCLHAELCSVLSKELSEIAEEFQIIAIEQKPEITSSAKTVIRLSKEYDGTSVEILRKGV